MTEREYAREAPFSPAGILGVLSNSLRRRELPREYEPRAEEDRAAIYLNQKEFDAYAMTDEVLGAVIRDHRAAFPLATLSCLFAVFMYPTLTAGDESPIAALAEQLDKRRSATIRENRRVNRSEAPREIAVMAGRLQSILESNLVPLYASIAGHQFWFMRAFWLNWWNRDAMSGPRLTGSD